VQTQATARRRAVWVNPNQNNIDYRSGEKAQDRFEMQNCSCQQLPGKKKIKIRRRPLAKWNILEHQLSSVVHESQKSLRTPQARLTLDLGPIWWRCSPATICACKLLGWQLREASQITSLLHHTT